MPDSLLTRVQTAIADRVADLTPRVPAERVFSRFSGEFAPERDKCPSLIVCQTPGASESVRKTLSGKTQHTFPVTVILVDSQNRLLTTQAAEEDDTDWRLKWRGTVIDALHGAKLDDVIEVLRVSVDPGAILDMTQFEVANLFWSAISLSILCRY